MGCRKLKRGLEKEKEEYEEGMMRKRGMKKRVLEKRLKKRWKTEENRRH